MCFQQQNNSSLKFLKIRILSIYDSTKYVLLITYADFDFI